MTRYQAVDKNNKAFTTVWGLNKSGGWAHRGNPIQNFEYTVIIKNNNVLRMTDMLFV